MPVQVIDNNRPDFAQVMMAVMEQIQRRKTEERAREQQESQFTRTMEFERPLQEAQVGHFTAATEATRAGTQLNERKQSFDENKANLDSFIKNAYEPLLAAGNVGAAEALRMAYADKNPLAGWNPRQATTLDEAAANLAQWKADVTKRVADGGQNAMDVNLATKLGTGEQLSAPQFAGQEQREVGGFKEYAAVKGGRAPSATDRLSAETQVRTTGMQTASSERIASAARESAERIAAAKTTGDPKQRETAEAMRNEALTLARDLQSHPGLDTASGVKGPSQWFGPLSAGTDGKQFVGKLNRLKSLLAFENLSALKGPLSDKDIVFLMQIPASLVPEQNSNQSMRDELGRVANMLEKAEFSGGGSTYRYTATNPQTGQRIGSNDGQQWEPIR